MNIKNFIKHSAEWASTHLAVKVENRQEEALSIEELELIYKGIARCFEKTPLAATLENEWICHIRQIADDENTYGKKREDVLRFLSLEISKEAVNDVYDNVESLFSLTELENYYQ